MCVHVYMYMCTCVYIYIYSYIYTHTHTLTYACTNTHINIHIYIYNIYTCVCMCVCVLPSFCPAFISSYPPLLFFRPILTSLLPSMKWSKKFPPALLTRVFDAGPPFAFVAIALRPLQVLATRSAAAEAPRVATARWVLHASSATVRTSGIGLLSDRARGKSAESGGTLENALFCLTYSLRHL